MIKNKVIDVKITIDGQLYGSKMTFTHVAARGLNKEKMIEIAIKSLLGKMKKEGAYDE